MATTKSLVFEIGTEEMPASAVEAGIAQLDKSAQKALAEARLKYGSLEVMGTPRRLVLMVKDLAAKQELAYEKVKGPAERVAFDEKKKPTAAALGFAKGQKVSVSDLLIEDTAQGRYVFARRALVAAKTLDVLPRILKSLVLSVDFPKSMRWNHGDVRFSRPIRWLLALYGREMVHVPVADLRSDAVTYGHPALGGKPIHVAAADEYVRKLGVSGVIVDQSKRRALILKGIEAAASSVGGRISMDEPVLKEVVHLVENPQAVVGSFGKEFLKLPRSVLVTAMESHQRYFPVENSRGRLVPFFVVVHNGNKRFNELIRRGHERVLRARLADAWFFLSEDLKVPLSKRVPTLKEVLFQESLGSLLDKTTRLVKLAHELGRQLEVPAAQVREAERAAYLAKADLTTNMVREFPNLQGVVGEEYALIGGEKSQVARSIAEHYLPRFVGDVLPRTTSGALVSMADKIDTIVGCFAAGFIPSGSEDPYALRRQGQAIVSVILDKKMRVSLDKVLEYALSLYRKAGFKVRADRRTLAELDNFFKQRLKFQFTGEGFRYDVAEAVLGPPLNNLLTLESRAREINRHLPNKVMDDVLTAFERCYNLSRGIRMREIDSKLFDSPTETQLYQAILRVEKDVSVRSLATLRPVVDRFFDDVLVMTKEKALRENRLSLLLKCVALFMSYADFSKIVRESP